MNGLDLLEKLDQLDPSLIEEAGLFYTDVAASVPKRPFFMSRRFRNMLTVAAMIVLVLVPLTWWGRQLSSHDGGNRSLPMTGSAVKQEGMKKPSTASPDMDKADRMYGTEDATTAGTQSVPEKNIGSSLSAERPQDASELFRDRLQMSSDLTEFYYSQDSSAATSYDGDGNEQKTVSTVTAAQKKTFLEALFAGQFVDVPTADTLRSGSYIQLQILLTGGSPLPLMVYQNGLIVYSDDLVLMIDEAVVAPFFADTAAPIFTDTTDAPTFTEGGQPSVAP